MTQLSDKNSSIGWTTSASPRMLRQESQWHLIQNSILQWTYNHNMPHIFDKPTQSSWMLPIDHTPYQKKLSSPIVIMGTHPVSTTQVKEQAKLNPLVQAEDVIPYEGTTRSIRQHICASPHPLLAFIKTEDQNHFDPSQVWLALQLKNLWKSWARTFLPNTPTRATTLTPLSVYYHQMMRTNCRCRS